ncbi:MAG: tripartite tricarboxylate transporter substrate binding protein [Burkholderiales bacterium]|nr:tripartite tricarboxylate transporter substrate binding protein [Burkholderiales bacterium]
MQNRVIARLLIAVAALTGVANLSAQPWPSRPVKLIVPWPPGTPADVAGRIVADRLGAGLGQSVVVENRPGATGTIGYAELGRQPADGYTVYMLSSATSVAPLLFANNTTDIVRGLEPVGLVAWSYNVLVTPQSTEAKNARELLAMLRGRPGALSFASGGNGTPAHLAGELFKQITGTQSVHVPYNQFAQAIGDLVAGRVQYMFLTASAAIPQIAGGKLKALAVSGAQRLPALKEVPTMVEEGFGDFVLRSFDGLTVRPGTPPEIIQRLNGELVKAVASTEVRDRLGALALEPEAMAPARFGQIIAVESEKWLRIGRAANIKAD